MSTEMNEAAKEESGKKRGFRSRLQAIRESRARAREQRNDERAEEKKVYEEERRKGRLEGARARGRREGRKQGERGGGGTMGGLKALGSFLSEHPMDVGETSKRMNSDFLGMGGGKGSSEGWGAPPSVEMFGGSGKRKKHPIEDELGF